MWEPLQRRLWEPLQRRWVLAARLPAAAGSPLKRLPHFHFPTFHFPTFHFPTFHFPLSHTVVHRLPLLAASKLRLQLGVLRLEWRAFTLERIADLFLVRLGIVAQRTARLGGASLP